MLTLVLGGARSGKSRHAQSLVEGRQAIYIATAHRDPRDREMLARIARHRADRPASWITIEEPEAVPRVVRQAQPHDAPVVVECVTLWLSNLLHHEAQTPSRKQQEILLAEVRALVAAGECRELIVVSNDVSGGLHPLTKLGRRFQDLQGWANQILAEAAQEVVLVVAGIPLRIKTSALRPT
ncbi:MAG: bifunctional adenosylcobinamide kinase/adenosylcobinamide-phosphate guanylyltransferase [Acidobacteria bacterium]|nr:bifunctional adenosylcobinamide kinase/adenosylcobinamide-phosphate guanylyltransferase [Acidobacteriota bacterium]